MTPNKLPMVDLHCHILTGVDDGASSLDESLAMARFCVADGMTHVFATPHCHRYIHLLRADILPHVVELNKQLTLAEIPLKVLPGSEIQVTDSQDYRREFEAGLFCHYGDTLAFTLMEFNWDRAQVPSDAAALVEWVCAHKVTPILAHPERHDYFTKDPNLLNDLAQAGAWVQVTVDSLLGNHGPAPKVAGEFILRNYTNAVLSTDAHRMSRCSGMSAGYHWVTDHLGAERADDLRIRANQVLATVTGNS